MKKRILLLSCLLVASVTSAYGEDKVVVIPLNSSEPPTCTKRATADTTFSSGYFLSLEQSCNPDEIAISGGFGIRSWSATNDCYVYKNQPNGKNGWEVSWASPTGNGCSGMNKTVFVSVLCCKW